MSYDRQLVFKDQKIRGNLERIGGLTKDQIDTVMQPVVGMEPPFGYRNKAQFPFGTDKEGNPITGFYAGRTHDIIANTDCALGVEQNKEILEIILQYMRENKIKSYDEKTWKRSDPACIDPLWIQDKRNYRMSCGQRKETSEGRASD